LSPAVHELFAVGRIVKAFGIQGEVIVRPMTDDPARFKKLKQVFLSRYEDAANHAGTPAVQTTIEHAQIDARGVRLRLKAIPDRTTAERSVGLLVMITRNDRIPLEDGRYFVHEMVGLAVVDETGAPLGTLAEVLRMPAHDVYVIRSGESEIMIPAVSEFVRSVDMTTRTMTVRLIDGMRE